MITQKITPMEDIRIMADTAKLLTEKELYEIVERKAKEKFCPSIKANCMGHGCAMFVLDRPTLDHRYLEARCTHAGKRPLVFFYGESKDYECND